MMTYRGLTLISLLMILTALPGNSDTLYIRGFGPDQGVCRANRSTTIIASLENTSEAPSEVKAEILIPKGVRLVKGTSIQIVKLPATWAQVSWRIEALNPGEYDFGLNIISKNKVIASSSFKLRFFTLMKIKKLPYIPTPEAVKTSMLIGAHNCPIWESDKLSMWSQIVKHPERTPALGFYGQENPEVSDWETKWAVEHGISFFIYCWYRSSQGEPVKMSFGSAIHQGLFKSKFGNQMKFTIMWENQQRGVAGVSDENDLMNNLLPFWINDYFKRSNYLKIDNKPVLFIYRPEFLIEDLGGIENVRKAFDKIRQACKAAGFDGLYILGEYRGMDTEHLKLMKQLGLDYTFAYCWYVPDSPTPEVAVKTQMKYINDTQDLGIIPQVVTVSQAWSGWADEGSIWKIPPAQFEGLLKQAKDFAEKLPADQLGSKMLLLDNWNEWGEGHYIAPYREYGFGYLDAVRKVFSNAPEKHTDLIPMDIGMGPYDKAYKEFTKNQNDTRILSGKSIRKSGSDEPGLVAWWTFDEAKDDPVVLDYSGHRLGGGLYQASRVKGINGNAMDCNGGWALIPSNPLLAPADGMTIDCWVYTDTPNQTDKWIVNRIYSGKTNSGYRFGFYQGRPCFSIPQTDWSHHLNADKVMPLGEWVHLAATYDGQMIRIYMNGEECGSLVRTGPVNPNDFDLCLGSFADHHKAHFTGKLDEVRLYNRALSADEIRAHVRKRK